MEKLKRVKLIGTFLLSMLGACAPAMKAKAPPMRPNTRTIMERLKPAPEKQTERKPVKRIVDGRTIYELKGKRLDITTDGKTKPPIKLGKVFRETMTDPAKADMRMDNFPPKMNREGRLLYVYSPGAKGIVVISPGTDETNYIPLSEKISGLTRASFDVKNGIIGITGAGANFVAIIGLGDLLKYETCPVMMRLDKILLGKKPFLLDPVVEVKGNRVYFSDDVLGKEKRYFFEVVNGMALPVTVEEN